MGEKFREIPCAVDIYFAGGKFRAKFKFENIANISSTRKILVMQYSTDLRSYSASKLHCYVMYQLMPVGPTSWIVVDCHFKGVGDRQTN